MSARVDDVRARATRIIGEKTPRSSVEVAESILKMLALQAEQQAAVAATLDALLEIALAVRSEMPRR